MREENKTSVLASYATLKSLSDDNKYQSPYQLLREFIRHIIIIDSIYTFSANEMKNRLIRHFDFTVPEAVIKTSLKNMEGLILKERIYTVSKTEISNNLMFETKKKEADDYEEYIIQLLSEYISGKRSDLSVNKARLVTELVHFLTGDLSSYSSAYKELIGEFILKNENNNNIQTGLNKIKEGSILYIGLSHNICEIGSIKKPLSLYLGTEILFSLVGFNGEIYRQFANDFFDQVRMANSGETKKLSLYYFYEIKKEIDEFFATACEIVEGKKRGLFEKPAMQAITNGCKTSADVQVKKSDFYHELEFGYGIKEDPTESYYDEIYFSTNLESFDYDDDDLDKNKKKETAIKLISHINKLRAGKRHFTDIESEHIIVTNTKATLLISKEQVDVIKKNENLENLCAFAISLDKITSLLWYKLGNGFSKKEFPSNVSAILNARTVLSSEIAKNAEKAFSEVKRQFDAGEITEGMVAARLITLRRKPIYPEDLQGDEIDEMMDFSPEYLSRYEEQVKATKEQLEEKEELIKSLKAETTAQMSKKDAKIASQEEMIKGIGNENCKLKEEIEEYKRKEAESYHKREYRKNCCKFAWSIIWKVILVLALGLLVAYVELELQCRILSVVIAVADIIIFVLSAVRVCKKDYQKYFSKEARRE